MKLLREGDKSRAICSVCEGLQTTTYQRRDVPFRHRKGIVKGVLAAVCDQCGTVVGIPQQSVPRIAKELEKSRHALEARLPRHLIDALNLTLHVLVGGPSKGAGVVLRYYLDRAGKTPDALSRLQELATGEEATGTGDDRLSVKLDDHYDALLKQVAEATGLTKTRVVRGIVVQAKRDVLDDERPKAREELASFLQMAGA